MKCPYCGLEFSETVLPLHMERCEKKPKPEEKKEEQPVKPKGK